MGRSPPLLLPLPRQIHLAPRPIDACSILPHWSIGDPLGLDRLESTRINSNRSIRNPLGRIPKGSIDSNRSIGDPIGLNRFDRLESIDRGSSRARSTRIDRSGISEGAIDSTDSNRSNGDPRGLDRFDRLVCVFLQTSFAFALTRLLLKSLPLRKRMRPRGPSCGPVVPAVALSLRKLLWPRGPSYGP